MAAEIDKVEREFVLTEAKQRGERFRLHAPGRTGSAVLDSVGRETLVFSPMRESAPRFRAGEGVSVHFRLHDQAFAFGAVVWKASGPRFELRPQGGLYRGLERRWPRIPDPSGLAAELLVPECEATAAFPRSLDFAEIIQPEETAGLDTSDLGSLVTSFRTAASRLASTSRLRMLHDGAGPENRAEAVAARFGRILYVPAAWAPGFMERDPSGQDRLVTEAMVLAAEGLESLGGDTELFRYVKGESREGLASLLVCPVVYWRSVVAFVHLANGKDRPRPLDDEAIRLSWVFSRQLAWFLRRHGYFGAEEHQLRAKAEIHDASPGGLQISLDPELPLLRPGSHFDLRLHFPRGQLPCRARVTRRVERGGRVRYGLSLEGLADSTRSALERGFYGQAEALSPDERA
ncbi:MAG TPA: PilZ domain-containing protein [Rectinemataceae bacterium]|nr:PilZ domain-containing protein [Rectinemataceae bacterium]